MPCKAQPGEADPRTVWRYVCDHYSTPYDNGTIRVTRRQIKAMTPEPMVICPVCNQVMRLVNP